MNWFGIVLNDKNKKQLFIPKGFAHGYCTLKTNTKIIYKVDEYYSPEHERGVLWNDPLLKISWPIDNPVLSEKDRGLPHFQEIENNFW
jgi:dTDP-4-dehydrorhamnose 3,5-epimerase